MSKTVAQGVIQLADITFFSKSIFLQGVHDSKQCTVACAAELN